MRCPHAVPRLLLLGATAMIFAACPAPEPEDRPVTEAPPADPTPEVTREVYEAQLREVDGSGVTGTVTIVMDDSEMRVTVRATGLLPDTEVPQHIHANATCDSPGGTLLNLDNMLALANEGAPRGEDYPRSDGDGALAYERARPLDDLRDAAREHDGPGVEELDLGNRVVTLHAADMRPVACGQLEGGG